MTHWTTFETLLLAQARRTLARVLLRLMAIPPPLQAVQRHPEDWLQVSRIVQAHPSSSAADPARFLQQRCAQQWSRITSEDPSDVPPAMRLMRQLYAQRVDELTQALSTNEAQYRCDPFANAPPH